MKERLMEPAESIHKDFKSLDKEMSTVDGREQEPHVAEAPEKGESPWDTTMLRN